MVKKPLNLLVDEDLVKKAREHGLNLSRFFENQLHGYFNFIEGRHSNFYHLDDNESSNNDLRRGGDLNSRGDKSPRALQARAVPGWATSAKNKYWKQTFLLSLFPD